ncbi:MAG: hypothetical protein MJ183_10355 [Treponemataceae bacterium]|nr:hypothetical protein [Treponemataceae bacterium]
MVKEELIERSPVRSIEKSVNGGLKAGEIGVLTSKKGLGKTSVLVQLGLDMLLQDKVVVHVSFNQHSNYVITWYENIFNEMAKKKNLADAEDVKAELVRKRVILNFSPDAVSAASIVKALAALKAGGIAAACLVIDGLDVNRVTAADLAELKAYGKEADMNIWFSFNSDADSVEAAFGADVAKEINTVINLEQKADTIQMKVLKAHDAPVENVTLKLDSKTLLISDK